MVYLQLRVPFIKVCYGVFKVINTFSGVGKTVIALESLNKMSLGGYYIPFILNFSAQTSSGRTQVM